METSSSKLVLLLGCTGRSGFHIACNLLESSQYKVRVVVRSSEKHSTLFQERSGHFESIIEGQINEHTLEKAFRPSELFGSVSIVISAIGSNEENSPERTKQIEHDFHALIIDQCIKASIDKILYISHAKAPSPWDYQLFTSASQIALYEWKAHVENRIKQSGLHYTILRPLRLVGDSTLQECTAYQVGDLQESSKELYRSTLGAVVRHTLQSKDLPDKAAFGCFGVPSHPLKVFDFKRIQKDNGALLRPEHLRAKRVHQVLLSVVPALVLGQFIYSRPENIQNGVA